MRTLIIVVSIIAIGATVATVMVGERSFDGLVVEKPYETGLDWDKTMQQRQMLGWRVSLDKTAFATGPNDLRIAVLDKSGVRLKNADVIMKITRLETDAYDRSYQAVRQPDGTYLASITILLEGNWQALVTVSSGTNRATYTIPLYASGGVHGNGHR